MNMVDQRGTLDNSVILTWVDNATGMRRLSKVSI